ncbi:tyrosine-protein phosphatase [Nocardia suismassiliense]|uniref:Tyrosine-protein phosphatase n=1 Tax=Nocardia suismassiliense TaxID=2077092 RepID=A0ABW6QS03_9NOCA
MNRHVDFERLHNFRDLGGYRTANGQMVRWGRLFRADSLSKLRDQDWERFLELGITTVIDLRYPWEIDAKGRVPQHESLVYHNLSIEHRPYDQAALGPEIEVGPYLAERFLEVAADGVEELRQAIEVLANADGPAVFHCASGKDRTGLLAALVLNLLGVSDEQIIEDFARTELATDRLIADWRAAYPDKELTWPGYGRAPAEVMRLFLAALAAEYGSVRGYTTERLGVDDGVIAALRRSLLETA